MFGVMVRGRVGGAFSGVPRTGEAARLGRDDAAAAAAAAVSVGTPFSPASMAAGLRGAERRSNVRRMSARLRRSMLVSALLERDELTGDIEPTPTPDSAPPHRTHTHTPRVPPPRRRQQSTQDRRHTVRQRQHTAHYPVSRIVPYSIVVLMRQALRETAVIKYGDSRHREVTCT